MSLKANFIYSSLLTTSTYVVSIVIFPYISRVLGLSNIGIVNFVDNLVNYFLYISMMGIMTVGVREIAAVRGNQAQLSKTFISLLALTVIATLLAITVLWIAMYTIPTLSPHRDLLYVGIIKLIFNLFLMEWFYIGMENFKYITLRSIVIRFLFVVSVFVFIKDSSDYKLFFVLSVSMVVANALVNLIYSRRFVVYSFKSIDIRPYYKPFLMMGVYILFTNVYTSLNVVWLGFVTDTDQVGYYTTATKLHTIIMAILTSFSNILFPRVSNLLAEGKREEYWEKINMSFDAIFLFAFPTICFMLTAGPNLLHLFVGNGFEGSYLPLRIIAPLILVIGLEQILVIQILMAMHQDNSVLRNSVIGALVTMLFNILLTSSMGAIGSAFVWVIAECVIMILSISVIYHKYHYLLPYKRLLQYCVAYIPLLLASAMLYYFMDNGYAIIITVGLLTISYTAVTELFVLKNNVVKHLLKNSKS